MSGRNTMAATELQKAADALGDAIHPLCDVLEKPSARITGTPGELRRARRTVAALAMRLQALAVSLESHQDVVEGDLCQAEILTRSELRASVSEVRRFLEDGHGVVDLQRSVLSLLETLTDYLELVKR